MRAVDDWVIDCDTHITEPGDVWTARLPARFQAEAPRLIRDDYGYDSWVFTACPSPAATTLRSRQRRRASSL